MSTEQEKLRAVSRADAEEVVECMRDACDTDEERVAYLTQWLSEKREARERREVSIQIYAPQSVLTERERADAMAAGLTFARTPAGQIIATGRATPPIPPHPRSANVSRRRLGLLEAVVEAARDLLDQTEDASIAASALADRLDDVDAYCERCDDTGVIVRVLGGEPTSPPPVTEVPCECEAARVIAAKRPGGGSAEPCLDCLRNPCRCALEEAGDLEAQIDHLLDEEPAS